MGEAIPRVSLRPPLDRASNLGRPIPVCPSCGGYASTAERTLTRRTTPQTRGSKNSFDTELAIRELTHYPVLSNGVVRRSPSSRNLAFGGGRVWRDDRAIPSRRAHGRNVRRALPPSNLDQAGIDLALLPWALCCSGPDCRSFPPRSSKALAIAANAPRRATYSALWNPACICFSTELRCAEPPFETRVRGPVCRPAARGPRSGPRIPGSSRPQPHLRRGRPPHTSAPRSESGCARGRGDERDRAASHQLDTPAQPAA